MSHAHIYIYIIYILNESKTEMILFRQKFRCDFSWRPDFEAQVQRDVQSCFPSTQETFISC